MLWCYPWQVVLLKFLLHISAPRWRTGFRSWWQLSHWWFLQSTSDTWQMVPGDSGSSQPTGWWLQVQHCKTAPSCTDFFRRWCWSRQQHWSSVGCIAALTVNTSSCVLHLQVSCVNNFCDSIGSQVAENKCHCLWQVWDFFFTTTSKMFLKLALICLQTGPSVMAHRVYCFNKHDSSLLKQF